MDDEKDLTPEAKLLGYDFSIAIQKGNNKMAFEILQTIERLSTIWRQRK